MNNEVEKIRNDAILLEQKTESAYAVIYLLDKKFNLSQEEFKLMYAKLNSQDVNDKDKFWEIAYNISNDFNFGSGAGTKIVEILEEVSKYSEEEKQQCHMNYLQALLEKNK